MNILDIHAKIVNYFKKQKEELSGLIYIRKELNRILLLDNVSTRLLNMIKSDLDSIEEIVNSVDYLEFYFFESSKVIQKYIDLINTPIHSKFFRKNENSNTREFKNIVYEYFEILIRYRKYFQNCHLPYHTLNFKDSFECKFCKNEMAFENSDNILICYNCNAEKPSMVFKNVNDLKTNKYNYDRNIQFKECIVRFQAKQNVTIPIEIFQNVKEAIEKYRIVNVELNHIHLILKNLGYTKYYEHFVLIHSLITGIAPPNVEHIQDQLINEFELLSSQLDQMKDLNLKNFNTYLVLFHLLKRHNFKFHSDHLLLVKSMERKLFTNKVCKTLFEKLGWKFTEI